jgi:hypothetical protein
MMEFWNIGILEGDARKESDSLVVIFRTHCSTIPDLK